MLIGSAINIWFNVTNIDPLLTPGQRALFVRTITLYNLAVYPVLGAVGAWLLLSLRGPFREQMLGRDRPASRPAWGPDGRIPTVTRRDVLKLGGAALAAAGSAGLATTVAAAQAPKRGGTFRIRFQLAPVHFDPQQTVAFPP